MHLVVFSFKHYSFTVLTVVLIFMDCTKVYPTIELPHTHKDTVNKRHLAHVYFPFRWLSIGRIIIFQMYLIATPCIAQTRCHIVSQYRTSVTDIVFNVKNMCHFECFINLRIRKDQTRWASERKESHALSVCLHLKISFNYSTCNLSRI